MNSMKVYLISNVEAETEDIVDALDDVNVSVVAKDIEGNAQDAAQSIGRQLGKGSADMLIFLTDDAMEAGMELNKVEGIKAAICSSPSQVQKAKARGANVIIIGDDAADKASIARAIASGGAGGLAQMPRPQLKKKMEERVQSRQADEEQAPEPAPIRINIKMPQLFAQKKAKAQPEIEDEPLPMGKPRKGLFGKLKDELGIMD